MEHPENSEEYKGLVVNKGIEQPSSTSANISGQPAPAVFSEITEEIKQAVDYVVDYRREETGHPKPSSIVKLGKGGVVKIIRE